MYSLIEQFLSSRLIHSLAWTLIHAFWQGLLLAIGTGIAVMLTRSRTANLRYNLILAMSSLFLLAVATTFIYECANYPGDQLLPFNKPGSLEKVAAGSGYPITFFISFCDRNAGPITLFWLIFVTLQISHLLTGLLYLQKLKQNQTFSPDHFWINRITEIRTAMRMPRPVKLLQSGIAKCPMVIGHLKPIILFPVGFLNALSTEEVEAILIHELAHVKRNDFLINIIQTITEILFFFNPAIWWVSSLIRKERENCCDDISVAIMKSKTNYVQALVSFQEYSFNAGQYTPAFPGTSHSLLDRVKRLAHNQNSSLPPTHKFILMTIAVFLVFLSVISSMTKIPATSTNKRSYAAQNGSQSSFGQPQNLVIIPRDTIPAKRKDYRQADWYNKKRQNATFQMKNGEVKNLANAKFLAKLSRVQMKNLQNNEQSAIQQQYQQRQSMSAAIPQHPQSNQAKPNLPNLSNQENIHQANQLQMHTNPNSMQSGEHDSEKCPSGSDTKVNEHE